MRIEYTEKEIEDFLSRRENLEKYLGLRFVARQVRTPVGVVDILAYHKNSKRWVIIELKKADLTHETYFQSERYKCYFESMKGNLMGTRDFVTLLVGTNLHNILHYSVTHYSKDLRYIYPSNVYYALFGFELESAISFEYIDVRQSRIESGDAFSEARDA